MKHHQGMFLLVCLCIVVEGAASPAWTQVSARLTPKTPSQSFQATVLRPNWSIKCRSTLDGKGLNCRMSRAVVLKKTRKLLLRVTVSLSAQTKKPAMLIQMPHGLYLPAGAKLQIDKQAPQSLVLQTCNQKGCFAGAPISSQMLTAMRKGQRLKVSFKNLKRKQMTVPVPLKGFAKAYNQMDRR